ncbi:MAG: cysteine desulfurase family protein [Thermoguttaceae bacterium]|jgi:cysteine desulfurase
MQTIYLDHNATTPTRPEVIEAMARCWAAGHANPASQHQPGQQARRLLEDARSRIAELLGADLDRRQGDRAVFTSGGTEANNLAVLGISRADGGEAPPSGSGRMVAGMNGGQARPLNGPGRIVVSAIEHSSVLGPAEHLLEQGWRVDTLGVDSNGVAAVERLEPLLSDQTRLVSVMLANHETGVLQPVAELAAVCRRAGVPLHSDAVAAVGKLPVHFGRLGVAAMSVAAHKFQGPLGIGVLVLRHDVPLAPLLFGGHQEDGLRPGTQTVALAVGMQTALELRCQDLEEHNRRLTALRDRFEAGLRSGYPGAIVHGAEAPRVSNTSNVAFPGLEGQILVLALDLAGVACSVGSACASGSTELSPTLRAMGLANDVVASSLRFSLGATTTPAEVDEGVHRIIDVCRQLRGTTS